MPAPSQQDTPNVKRAAAQLPIEVSIVVPAYNAEAFLGTFFMCVCGQTFQGFRLVFVDDGSVDGTAELALSLGGALGERFVLLRHEHNRGLPAARNTGLDWVQAHPTAYVSFLDADDWFEPGYLEDLYVMAEAARADLCIAGIVREDAATGRLLATEMTSCPTPPVDDLSACQPLAYLNPCAYAKLYRFAPVRGLRFRDLARSEDTCYLFEALPSFKRVVFTNRALYHYQARRARPDAQVACHAAQSMHEGFARMLPLFDEGVHAPFRQLFEVQVFLRSSVGGVLAQAWANAATAAQLARDELAWLDASMPAWRANPLLGARLQPFASATQQAVGLCARLYRAGAFPAFVHLYRLASGLLGREVRF